MARINDGDERIEYDFGLPVNGAADAAFGMKNGQVDPSSPANGYGADPFDKTYVAQTSGNDSANVNLRRDSGDMIQNGTSRRERSDRFADDLDLL